MRAVVQRVLQASVRVDGEIIAAIGRGYVVLLAVESGDDLSDVLFLKRKLAQLRLFEDAEGRMNRSLTEIEGEILLVSQFTLYGDCRKGNRPSFSRAAEPAKARNLYRKLADELRKLEFCVKTGQFKARMLLSLQNDGPVTVIVDSQKKFY